MSRRSLLTAAAIGCVALSATPAAAHITLEIGKAPIGAAYKAVFRIPHGCDGSATIKLRVEIPDGVIEVKPQPKPGWQVETVKGMYAAAVTFEGTRLTTGVKEVVWSGGKLPDDFYDEFVFEAFLTDSLPSGTTIYFPVIQQCEAGIERWIEIPEPGKTPDDYEHAAPALALVPNAGSDD